VECGAVCVLSRLAGWPVGRLAGWPVGLRRDAGGDRALLSRVAGDSGFCFFRFRGFKTRVRE
jgi:hypothetical protein